MSDTVKIAFAPLAAADAGALVVFAGADLKLGADTARASRGNAKRFCTPPPTRSASRPRRLSAMDLVRPAAARRRAAAGRRRRPVKPTTSRSISPISAASSPASSARRSVSTCFSKGPEGEWDAAGAAEFALGFRLRAYKFDKYKSKKPRRRGRTASPAEQGDDRRRRSRGGARAPMRAREAVAEGVELARNLVNEPPNVLYPESFADRAKELGEARRRGRDSRREGDEQARHGRAARRSGRAPRARAAVVVMRWQRREVEEDGSRSPSSARASASTPAASRSSRPPAWRT